MTQQAFDDKILAVAQKGVDMAAHIADLRRQGDPAARRLEEEYMMLQNCLTSLKDYDITSDLLSDDDIKYVFELSTSILQTCP